MTMAVKGKDWLGQQTAVPYVLTTRHWISSNNPRFGPAESKIFGIPKHIRTDDVGILADDLLPATTTGAMMQNDKAGI